MSTALKNLIRDTLAGSTFPPVPDYSATAHDVAAAIEQEFDVRPNTAAHTETTPGLCWNVGPTPITNGTPGSTPLCELRSGHVGAHEAGATHWSIRDPYLDRYAAIAGNLFARQADDDLALSELAASLTGTTHSLGEALRLVTSYINAGGNLTTLRGLAPASPLVAGMNALAAAVETSTEPLVQAAAKVIQGNDVAGVVIDQFRKHWPDLYPVLSLRYGIADALWNAGYRSNVTAAAEVPIEEDQRLSAWDKIAAHPFFASCYADERALFESMLAKLNTVGVDHPTTDPTTPPDMEP